MRYFVKFAYNGKNYHGWQMQPDAISVQEVFNKALSTLLRENIEVVGAGRTDAGVHAQQMFAHFDSNQILNSATLVKRMNSFLPKDIVVYDFILMHNEAHARFDAVSRTYQYHIHNFKDAFIHEGSWYQHQTLDVAKMNEAAQLLFNYIDFECFSKTHTDVNTFNCQIKQAFWTQNQNHLVFTITADRFLRNMVRAIVGTLVNVGLGKLSIAGFQEVIESKSRKKAGFSVPAHGLYLTQVIYPYLNNENN
ncbi:tRNA pseudouridine(38-40) synthase TruA [Flavobacterium agricola]|uniref:tRNA pseudouridine synthase A n=1 Tax=Flavobacterium agricola TaxID=2870839 RepID=A0ABY6M310_9FLAO|nr:tRNA pseudouridine(38-40) synthase TruA [Flavobacterium agricola]UYW01738.1 tRNA pseudouridine(38-40) synthase TruA [Flavobacterium agricola]